MTIMAERSRHAGPVVRRANQRAAQPSAGSRTRSVRWRRNEATSFNDPVGSLSQHLERDRMRGRREQRIELRELVGRQADIQGTGILLQPTAISRSRYNNHVTMTD